MSVLELQVPFSEKDLAKGLGAKWNPAKKVWFVPDGIDSSPFKQWLPKEPEYTIRADSYFIAETSVTCWKCNTQSRVFGFLLPPGHETVEPDIDEDGLETDDCYFDEKEWATFPFYITTLPGNIVERMNKISGGRYHPDFSKVVGDSYWMNHCEHCNAKQGDFKLFSEPGKNTFLPLYPSDAETITIHEILEPFFAESGSYVTPIDHLEYMKRP